MNDSRSSEPIFGMPGLTKDRVVWPIPGGAEGPSLINGVVLATSRVALAALYGLTSMTQPLVGSRADLLTVVVFVFVN